MEQGGKGASLRALWSRSSGAPHHESNHVDTGTNQLQQDNDTLVAGSPSYLSHLPPRWSPNQKSNVNNSFRSTEDASYFPSSPSTSSRMYHQNPVGSPIGQRSSPYQSPIERPVSIDRTSPSLIPKELPQRRGVRTNMYSHASLPRHHPFNFPSAAPGEDEKVGSAALGGDVLDPDDQVLFQRDPESAPRRNHTIATASMPHHRRLDQHFQQSSSDHNNHAPLAPGMLDERDSLFSAPKKSPEEVDADSIWKVSAPFSSHRRFPSQPSSTLATSPLLSSHSPIDSSSTSKGSLNHTRSESAHTSGLEHGPFASSPFSPGSTFNDSASSVRRHQSLNYHTGRQMARRIQGDKSKLGSVNPGESPFASTQLNNIAGTSPVTRSKATLSSPLREARETEPENNASRLLPSLVDVHHRLSHMSIQPASGSALRTSEGQVSEKGTDTRQKLPSLITNHDILARSAENGGRNLTGPVSASAYVPPIGHAHQRHNTSPTVFKSGTGVAQSRASLAQSAFPITSDWSAKEAIAGRDILHSEADSPGLGLSTQEAIYSPSSRLLPMPQSIHSNATPQTHTQTHNQNTFFNAYHNNMQGFPPAPYGTSLGLASPPPNVPLRAGAQAPSDATALHWNLAQVHLGGLPMDSLPGRNYASQQVAHNAKSQNDRKLFDPVARDLIETKGLNPSLTQFNPNPPVARFFVIKSYTEDDVYRSLKHEIWASTEKGNQRLDRAFKESAQEGPLYLFFSVNGSGHFCGLAQMLTPLDYETTSNVWALEGKWKGTFKVRWIYVKDVPNNALRHIRLTNTSECKPIVQSRDTQELPQDGGRQALRVLAEYPSRTTLLQDWLYYENQLELSGGSTGSHGGLSSDRSHVRPQQRANAGGTPSHSASDTLANRQHTPSSSSPYGHRDHAALGRQR